MERQILIPDSLLTNESFRTDLRDLLDQVPEMLLTLADVADHPEGFSLDRASSLQARTGIDIRQASSLMQISRYLYDGITTEAFPLQLAVDQLCEIGTDLTGGINEEKRAALVSLLAYKGSYERDRLAKLRSFGSGPHYEGISGSWTISIQKT